MYKHKSLEECSKEELIDGYKKLVDMLESERKFNSESWQLQQDIDDALAKIRSSRI